MGAPEHITNKYTYTIKQESYSHAGLPQGINISTLFSIPNGYYVQGNAPRNALNLPIREGIIWLNGSLLKGSL